jgi:hypothetical protein
MAAEKGLSPRAYFCLEYVLDMRRKVPVRVVLYLDLGSGLGYEPALSIQVVLPAQLRISSLIARDNVSKRCLIPC